MQTLQNIIHLVRVIQIEDDFEEIQFNNGEVNISLIHCISDDIYSFRNVPELSSESLAKNQDVTDVENDIKRTFGITSYVAIPLRNDNLPEIINGLYFHKLLICSICSVDFGRLFTSLKFMYQTNSF